jgi:hypothetical protein
MNDQAEAVVDEPEVSAEAEEYAEESQIENESDELASDDADDESDEGEAEDFDEIEYEGKKYAVPKELKDAFLRQGDYTRKTQEVAEQRKALEEQQASFQQAAQLQQANLQAYAQLSALDGQLQQYGQVDWQKYSESDPVQAQQAWFQYQALKDQRSNIAGQISQHEQMTLQQQREMTAKQLEKGKQVLAAEIPNWSADLGKELSKVGVDAYGFQPEEMQQVIDPRMVKVLHDAAQYRKIMTKAKAKPNASPDAKPVRSVKGKSPARKDPSKMTTEEWMAWRNKQVSR